MRIAALSCLFLLAGCGGSADSLVATLSGLSGQFSSREELADAIGAEPDRIASADVLATDRQPAGVELWAWSVDGGRVEMLVGAVGGKWIPQPATAAKRDGSPAGKLTAVERRIHDDEFSRRINADN